MPRPEYAVEGYDVVNPEYDAPYHPSATLDVSVFDNAGDTEASAKANGKRKKHPKDNLKESKRTQERVLNALVASDVPEAPLPKANDPHEYDKGVKEEEPKPAKKAAAAPAKKATAKKATAKKATAKASK